MKVALFQFATNAVGQVSAIFENMLALYLINGLEKAAGLRVVDLMPPSREGEVLSLTQVLSENEVKEASERVGADISIWGNLNFKPEEQPVLNEVEITLLAAKKDGETTAESRHFTFDALRGDVRTAGLNVEIPALEDLVEEMLTEIGEIAGLEPQDLHMNRIGEGLSTSDRAATYFIYALRITSDPAEKLNLYLKAIAADPNFALGYTNAAQLLLGEGNHGEAMKLLLRAENSLKGGELEPDILNLLGVATMHMGMWEEAVEVWERALRLKDDHVEALCNLAAAYSMREMPEEAEEYYRKALAFRDDYPLAWFSLGRLLAREEKYEEAEDAMRRYIELCPGDPWAYYVLGTSLAKLGRDEEAKFALGKAAQLDPDGEAGSLARHELYELKE